MRNQYFLTILKKMTFALMIFTLLWSAGVPTIARAAETTVPVVETYAYYTSGGHLYRVGKDGAKPQLLVSDYEGASIILGGKFLY